VTGGAGFIGSHIVERLLKDEWEVVVLDNFSGEGGDNLVAVPRGSRIRVEKGDVREPAAVRRALQGVDTVFHLAAIVSVQAGLSDPRELMEVNAAGTLSLLENSVASGVRRFILASSAAVYGRNQPPLRESTPTSPISPYGRSKQLSEEHCLKFEREFNLEVIVLRYFNVYGPRSRGGAYAAVITKFAKCLTENEMPVVYGSGEQTRDFVEVSDVVEASLLAARSRISAGKTYNVGTGRPTTISRLLDLEIGMLGKRPSKVRHLPARAEDIDQSFADISLAARDLSFRPSVSLEAGLDRYLRWYAGTRKESFG
jgi:nucleoside-diphosphate-sugar epimerase